MAAVSLSFDKLETLRDTILDELQSLGYAPNISDVSRITNRLVDESAKEAEAARLAPKAVEESPKAPTAKDTGKESPKR
jgi:hypothetical protein